MIRSTVEQALYETLLRLCTISLFSSAQKSHKNSEIVVLSAEVSHMTVSICDAAADLRHGSRRKVCHYPLSCPNGHMAVFAYKLRTSAGFMQSFVTFLSTDKQS